jgi:hypothetical protein
MTVTPRAIAPDAAHRRSRHDRNEETDLTTQILVVDDDAPARGTH